MKFTDCIDITGKSCKKFGGKKLYISTGAVDVDHVDSHQIEMVNYDTKPSRANLITDDKSILFAKMQGTKKVLLINKELENNLYSTGFFSVSPKKNILNKKCLYHLLGSKTFLSQKDKYCSGATQKAISLEGLNKIEITIPNLEEQYQIAKTLDSINAIIKSYEKELKKYDELIKARFIEMFGNPATPGDKFKTCKLGEVADVKSSHRVFSTEFVNEGVPFYRGTEISVLASGQQPEDPYRISMDHYLKIASDDSKPIRGDLLLPSICNKGQVWMVNTDEPFYYKDGRVLCISPHCSLFDSRYLQFYMKMRTEAEYPKLGSGSTFAEFKIFQLKELLVDIPPMNAQKSFCLFADQVDKSKLAVQKSLEKTQQLFDSLMQEYFG